MGTSWRDVKSTRHPLLDAKDIGLERPSHLAPSAWFLGPNAENLDFMREMVTTALDSHAQARRDYAPDDPNFVDNGLLEHDAHEKTRAAMMENLGKITNALRSSIPLSSYRNQSHMYWDITMPGAVGYFTGMLYNQNNVAAEASPVTTALEIDVAKQLCGMLGYDPKGDPEPWGHITCDGSVANAESMWAARNLRYQTVALARAIRLEASLKKARKLTILKACGTRVRLMDLEPWELINVPNSEALNLPKRMVEDCGIEETDIRAAIDTYSAQAMGLATFHQEVLKSDIATTPAIIVPATAHYSWDKGAAILGLGAKAVEHIEVDLYGRMDIVKLREKLDECLEANRPVIQVVAVIGTTEEGAVDHLDKIVALREEYSAAGLTFALHADAAWGGYFASLLREPPKKKLSNDGEGFGYDETPREPLSDHTHAQFLALKHADTITIDPHKAGYIPYPAGALCYRDREMIHLVAHEAPVVFHDENVPTVGVYGIEGSKPGAAAVGVALSHATIPLDTEGYGRLLGRCIFNSKRFYAALVTLAAPSDLFTITPFQRLPAEQDGGTKAEIAEQREWLYEKVTRCSNEELVLHLKQDPELLKVFKRLGPDLTVFAYAFNFKIGDKVNKKLLYMNELNNMIYNKLSLQEVKAEGKVPDNEMFVTSSQFSPGLYGKDFLETFAHRAGAKYKKEENIRFLISSMQNPWLTETMDGNFIPQLREILKKTVLEARDDVIKKYSLGGAS